MVTLKQSVTVREVAMVTIWGVSMAVINSVFHARTAEAQSAEVLCNAALTEMSAIAVHSICSDSMTAVLSTVLSLPTRCGLAKRFTLRNLRPTVLFCKLNC